MQTVTLSFSTDELLKIGFKETGPVHYQLSPDELVQQVLNRGEGILNDTGALVIHTGEFTGRSPKDKFIVQDETTCKTINWNEFNIPISSGNFDNIYKKALSHLSSQPELWVRDCFACADPENRLSIRVINEKPANNLFAYNRPA
jgi:phosphoenolpyruvate carboxykinase (ATP)